MHPVGTTTYMARMEQLMQYHSDVKMGIIMKLEIMPTLTRSVSWYPNQIWLYLIFLVLTMSCNIILVLFLAYEDWLKPNVVLEAFEARTARMCVACAQNLSKFSNAEEGKCRSGAARMCVACAQNL